MEKRGQIRLVPFGVGETDLLMLVSARLASGPASRKQLLLQIMRRRCVGALYTFLVSHLLERQSAARQITLEQGDCLEKTMEQIKMQLAGIFKAMTPKKSIRVSDASSIVCRDVQSSAGVSFELMPDLFDATKHTECNVHEFHWALSMESAQVVEYVGHIWRELVKSNPNRSVINGNKHPHLLDNDLGGMKFKGTVDVAIVVKAAQTLPAAGLKIIFELKKVNKINGKAEYWTVLSLLPANAVCNHYRPVAILSDLGDKWIFFWMDGLTVLHHEFATRSKAVGFLDAILESDVEAGDHSHDIAVLSRTGELSSRGVKRSFSGRQNFWPLEMERLEELTGFLHEDELWQDHAAIALPYALKIPGFYSVVSEMRESSKSFFGGMYL